MTKSFILSFVRKEIPFNFIIEFLLKLNWNKKNPADSQDNRFIQMKKNCDQGRRTFEVHEIKYQFWSKVWYLSNLDYILIFNHVLNIKNII